MGEKNEKKMEKMEFAQWKYIERNEMIQFQVHQRDFNLLKKVKRPYLQVVSQIQSTQDCRKMKVKLAFATRIT